MQIQVYVPQTIDIPNEYLPALAQRAHAGLGSGADVPATRGYLVRQAIKDGLLRDLYHLLREDGTVDAFCDPAAEVPLQFEKRTLKLSELVEALQNKRTLTTEAQPAAQDSDWVEQARAKTVAMPRRNAA